MNAKNSIQIILNTESGNLTAWAEQESIRLSSLKTFQPNGWNAVGAAKAYKKLNSTLRAAGINGSWRESVSRDICDMARLKAAAK